MSSNGTKTDSKTNRDHRQQQLIEAAIDAIAQHGLSRITVAKVAKAADLSQGIVNFYFSSKDQLLLSTLQYLSDEFNQALEATYANNSDPFSCLTAIIDLHFDPQFLNRAKLAVWYAFSSEGHARRDYLAICGQRDQAFRAHLLDLINAWLSSEASETQISSTGTTINTEAIMRGFEGMLGLYWQDYLHDPDKFNSQQAEQVCLAYLQIFAASDENTKALSTHHASQVSTATADLLAPWTYLSDEFLTLEKQHIFKKSWLWVGHINDFTQKGDYLTFDALGERALVLRGDDDQLQAFHNVCRHRGAKVLHEEKGHCPKVINCPFHGWTYNLDGSLRNVPRADTFTGLDKQSQGLIPINMEVWQGFIFINFDNDAPSLASQMAPVEKLIAPYQLDALRTITDSPYLQLRPYNWKTIHDIDNEGYHVPRGHPSLQQLYGDGYEDSMQGQVPVSTGQINKKPAKLWSVRQYQQTLPRFEHLPEDAQRKWLYVSIFPSTVIALYPEMTEVYMSLPSTVGETQYRGASYALPDKRREVKLARYLNHRINRITDQEDKSFVSWVQTGFESSVFPQSQLSSLEHGVRHLHKRIQALIPAAMLANEPPTGSIAATNEQMRQAVSNTGGKLV